MVYGPPAWRPAAFVGAAAVVATLSAFSPVFLAPAAVLLAVAVRDWLTRPALTLSPDGFRYAFGLGHAAAAWELVETVRVRQERHLLAFGQNLEIDLRDDTLVVLSHFQLAAPVEAVADAFETAWRAAPTGSGDRSRAQEGRDDEQRRDGHDPA